MSDQMGMTLKRILAVLHAYSPESLAGSWDNVGLLLEPAAMSRLSNDKPPVVTNIMVTNDLTRQVMDEALNTDTNLIVSYHPPIFAPLKQIVQSSWKQSLVVDCLQHRIAVYSPHTALDAITNGSNDFLLKPFVGVLEPIEPVSEGSDKGAGRFFKLTTPISLDTAVSIIKTHLGLSMVRLARSDSAYEMVRSIAVCAGAGASVLKGVKADLYITGEMSHHETLDACQSGVHVLCCEHTNTERQFLRQQYVPDLQHLLPSCHVFMSSKDKEPFQYV